MIKVTGAGGDPGGSGRHSGKGTSEGALAPINPVQRTSLL